MVCVYFVLIAVRGTRAGGTGYTGGIMSPEDSSRPARWISRDGGSGW